jgi:hypothetical protein
MGNNNNKKMGSGNTNSKPAKSKNRELNKKNVGIL